MGVSRRFVALSVLAATALLRRAALAQEIEKQPEPEPPAPIAEPAPAPPDAPPPPPPDTAPSPPSPLREPVPSTMPPRPRRVSARFGSQGVFTVNSDSSIGVGGSTFENSDAEYFAASFSPGLDYFVVHHVSVGLDLGIAYSNDRGYAADSSLVRTEATTLSAGPRLGVDLPLGRAFSFYPRVTAGVEYGRRTDSVVVARSGAPPANPTGIPSSSREGPWVLVFTPLLFHPTSHFYLGAGPTFFHAFARVQGGPEIGGERTSVGGHLIVGVWWGGEPDGDAPEDTSPAPEPTFGEIGQVVFTGELDLGGGRTTYAGTGSSSEAIAVAPGIDYFVARHVSIGFAANFAYGRSVALRADGTPAERTITGGGLAPRIGVDVPIASGLSLYPRASIAFGGRTYETRAGRDGYEYRETLTTGTLFAPLLVHPATHAFLGLGPYVGHDFTRKLEGGVESTPATSYGADLVVGGWL